MSLLTRTRVVVLIAALVPASATLAQGVDVWTVGVNNTRQGWNRFETVLTPANVPKLRKIREFVVDEKIDVSPLVVGRQALCVHDDEHGVHLRRQQRGRARETSARRAVRPGRHRQPAGAGDGPPQHLPQAGASRRRR